MSISNQPEETSGQPSVDRAELKQEVSDQLEREVGQAPDRIDCPGDLTGEVGTNAGASCTPGRTGSASR